MNKFREYRFISLLILTGLLFFGYEGMRDRFQSEMQDAWEETVDHIDGSLSENKFPQISVSENTEMADKEENMAQISGNDTDVSTGGSDPQEDHEDGKNSAAWSYMTVDESYFDDAVFIGDSRTVGLYDYAGLDNAAFYASSGLTVYKLFEEPDGKYKDGNWPENIGTALGRQQYAKVYLMIGINEMGTGDVDYFMKHYTEAVQRIRQLQPNAIIYLESIMRVTTERSAKGDYITNQGIDERNARIAQLADNQTIFYLDVNSVVCDEAGGLNPEYTFDGVHLYAQYIDIWKQYLMTHAVNKTP